MRRRTLLVLLAGLAGCRRGPAVEGRLEERFREFLAGMPLADEESVQMGHVLVRRFPDLGNEIELMKTLVPGFLPSAERPEGPAELTELPALLDRVASLGPERCAENFGATVRAEFAADQSLFCLDWLVSPSESQLCAFLGLPTLPEEAPSERRKVGKATSRKRGRGPGRQRHPGR